MNFDINIRCRGCKDVCCLILFLTGLTTISSRSLSREVWTNVRLAGGRSVFEGRVEVNVNGTWGTVCDDSWSKFDGLVVCRQLGYDNVISVLPGGTYGAGTGPIFHDDLQCMKNDTSLDQCKGLHDPNLTDCIHAEDAGVRCAPPTVKSYVPTCGPHQYKCFANNKCIPKRWVCDGRRDCPDHSDENSVICQNGKCGMQGTAPVSHRIIGGRNSRVGSWPWMASIRVPLLPGMAGSTLCGGTLINKYWVVTAAHCFDEYKPTSSFHVVFGDYDIRVNETTEQEISIHNVYIPSTYKPGQRGARDDIALIRLAESVNQHTTSVTPACLPSIVGKPMTSSNACYVTGWGYTNVKEARGSTKLQQAQVPVIDTSVCNYWYNNTLPHNVLCAGYQYGGIDACKGDSGGPLSCRQGSRWYLAGVVSWGNGCAQPYSPGVYTDVSKYIEWIASVTITANKQGMADVIVG